MEFVVLRRLYARDHLDQVLATFALILIFNQSLTLLFGRQPLFVSVPPALNGSVQLLPGLTYPVYRLVIIAAGLLVALGLYLLINRAEVPFGGVKDSGYGREGGAEGLAHYMTVKTLSHRMAI